MTDESIGNDECVARIDAMHGGAPLDATVRIPEAGRVFIDSGMGLSDCEILATEGATTLRCGDVSLTLTRHRGLLTAGTAMPGRRLVLWEGDLRGPDGPPDTNAP